MRSYIYVLRSIPSSPQADMTQGTGAGGGVGGVVGGGGLCIKIVCDALRYHSTGVKAVTKGRGEAEGRGEGGRGQGEGGKKKRGGIGGGGMTFGQCRGGGEAIAEMGLCCLRSLFRNELEAEEVARGTQDLQLVLQVYCQK
jgi:hypothetical protein